jgi:hypothetical protein
MNYLRCLAQARLNQMDGGSAQAQAGTGNMPLQPLTEEERAGQRILQGLGNACARERSAARAEAGSDAKQQANDLVLYKLLEGNDHSRASMRTFSQTNWVGTGKATVAYWQCTAQARLNQMDGGSTTTNGGSSTGNGPGNAPSASDGPKGPVPNVAVNTVMNGPAGLPACISIQKVGTRWASPKAEIDPTVVTTVRMTNACGKDVLLLARYAADGMGWSNAAWFGGATLFTGGALRSWPVGPARPVLPFAATDRDMVEPLHPGTVEAEIRHGDAKVYGPINFKLAYCSRLATVDGEQRINVLFHEAPSEGVGRIACVPLPKGY